MSKDSIRREINRKQHEIVLLQERLDCLDRFPEDNFDNRTVIKFRKRFVGSGKAYDYAAIKADDLWYTTGPRSPKGYTWDQLTEWMGDNRFVNQIWMATTEGWVGLLSSEPHYSHTHFTPEEAY